MWTGAHALGACLLIFFVDLEEKEYESTEKIHTPRTLGSGFFPR
jgi:hypothetical protein